MMYLPFMRGQMGMICICRVCVPRSGSPVTAYVKIVAVIGGAALNHLAYVRCG